MQKKKESKKKIYIYLLIFFMLTTFSNSKFLDFNFFQNDKLEILYKNQQTDENVKKILSKFSNKNIFFLKKQDIKNLIDNEPIVENFSIYKNYPSTLKVDVINTEFLAIIKKNQNNYFIGSNGNLIKFYDNNYNLPLVYGEVEIDKFLQLIKIMKKLNFNYNQIKNLYYFKSKRWDIEIKNGLLIKIPRDSIDQSFETVIKIMNHSKRKDISMIDLRQKNQVILW